MSAFFEIAYATASKRLCLFTGTGFSKAVTNNSAPSWQGLLENMCNKLPDPASTKNVLFPVGGKKPLSLEEAAQVVGIELKKVGLDIHTEIAKEISAIKPAGNNTVISQFLQNNPLTIVTTNYDKLIETLAKTEDCHSIAPGYPIPRSPARVEVYHVHGSIDAPQHMVVTSDDYFRFINGNSYFSRKLSTILHENTVVIIGYSLGDTNLKAILSDYKGFSRNHMIGGNLFLVSRDKVEQPVKDYYAHCYGIRVLDQYDPHTFFTQLNAVMPSASKCAASSREDLNNVLYKKYHYVDDYLKVESSFFEIVTAAGAIGKSIADPAIVQVLEQIISKKTHFSGQNGAWGQYAHLAKWLIHLGAILELSGTSVKDTYLAAVLRSMNTMSQTVFGYSWHAYTSWSVGWSTIIAANRALIKDHIEANTSWGDALDIVRRP